MDTKDLYEIANSENIQVYTTNFKDMNAFYHTEPNLSIIGINISLNGREEKSAMCEELSHHFVGVEPNSPFSSDYYNRLIRARNENRASKYCVHNFINTELQNAFKLALISLEEFASEAGITEEFAEKICRFL